MFLEPVYNTVKPNLRVNPLLFEHYRVERPLDTAEVHPIRKYSHFLIPQFDITVLFRMALLENLRHLPESDFSKINMYM